MIRVVGKSGKGGDESQLDEAAKGVEFVRIDCTSGNPDPVMREGLSPFFLGPVETYDGLKSQTFELAWQCAKVYPSKVDVNKEPTDRYFQWRDANWAKVFPKDFKDKKEIRHPESPDDRSKDCLYARWKVDGVFKRLGYVESRKVIYIPLYARAVVNTEAFRRLCAMRDEGKNLLLVDFDGYNPHLPRYNFTYNDVIHCPLLKMGHGFVLAMLLEGVIKVDEDGHVSYADGLMDDPHKYYSPDLRKLTDDQKLERAASCAGITVDELQSLSEADRKMLKRAYSREACKARGIARAAWKRLPLAEKLLVARLEEETGVPADVNPVKVASSKSVKLPQASTEEKKIELTTDPLPRPEDLTGYFDAGGLADTNGAIPDWVAADRSDIVRLWVPKTVVSIGSFAFKGCANLEEVVFEVSSDGVNQAIGTMAFAGCPKLVKVVLSAAVRSIGSGAFRDDGALATFQVDPFWKQIQIGSHAFDNCPALPQKYIDRITRSPVVLTMPAPEKTDEDEKSGNLRLRCSQSIPVQQDRDGFVLDISARMLHTGFFYEKSVADIERKIKDRSYLDEFEKSPHDPLEFPNDEWDISCNGAEIDEVEYKGKILDRDEENNSGIVQKDDSSCSETGEIRVDVFAVEGYGWSQRKFPGKFDPDKLCYSSRPGYRVIEYDEEEMISMEDCDDLGSYEVEFNYTDPSTGELKHGCIVLW